jgi:hypothetical protein
MKKLIFSALVTALLVSQLSFAANNSCEGLASLKLPDTTITLVQSVATGKLTPGGGGRRGGVPLSTGRNLYGNGRYE